MSLETAQYIHQLNPSNPSGADRQKDGDDHLRMLKAALKNTFPGIQGPLDATVTHTLLNTFAAQLVPVGIMALWVGTEATVPAGWAICDGRTVTRSDGSASITTPNMTDKVPSGVNVAGGRPVGTAFGAFTASAATDVQGNHAHSASTSAAGAHSHGGATGVTALSVDQMPQHSHRIARLFDGGTPLNSAPNSSVTHHGTFGSDPQYILEAADAGGWAGPSEPVGGGQGHAHGIGGDGVHTHPVTIDATGAHAHNVSVNTAQPSMSVYFIMKI